LLLYCQRRMTFVMLLSLYELKERI
jgi:hypothetical protein